jgi:ATP-dependent Clp protease ATP-binding subunit ClpB
VAAATLSNRYITGRQLPDKAIDLVDEAASRLRMEIDSSPEEIDTLRRQVDRLQMEEMALAREDDPASRARLEKLRADLADRKEQLAALTARWEREKAGLNRVGELKERLDALRGQAERLQREAIRVLAPLEDRGALCENQRGLAQILVEQGRIEEAERYALEARETVGREDVTSGATTRVALATVRAAQGREDEAHELFREALAVVERTEMRWVELEVLCAFAQFLRDSGREDDDPGILARHDELATVAPPGYTDLAAPARAA